MDKETTSRTGPITSTSVGRVDTSSPDFIYLQTARVGITGPMGRSRLTRCMLDGGSQCSFVARSIIDDLQLEVVDQQNVVRLACSKNRLAPVKKVTLPRLELLAALVGARLLHYFCQATCIDIMEAALWSDSTVALGWICQDPNRWKTFVCNQVTEIQSYMTPSQWRHCPGKDNPADLLSRGVTAKQLKIMDVWWCGPSWLAQPPWHWPPNTPPVDVSLPEGKGSANRTPSVEVPQKLLDPTKYSSYWKLLRVTAWILRFRQITLRKEGISGNLTALELEAARSYWIQAVQGESFAAEFKALQENLSLPEGSKIARFNPFLDDGFIRLGGRLQFAELSCGHHPLLLDGQHHFTKLLILQTHIRLHHLGVRIILAELREEFWILRAWQAIKQVLHSCLPCRMAEGLPGGEMEAPLPTDRVTPLRPFAVTGIDYAGPLFVKVGNTLKKSYIALFTCATTRAVHLELCLDMSTDK